MEQKILEQPLKLAKKAVNPFKVMKMLSEIVKEELESVRPLKVTYISMNKKPKLSIKKRLSELSTDEE